MRKFKEVLCLKFEVGLSARQIAVSLQVGRATIGDYLNRFAASGLTWPFAASDTQLQQYLYPPQPALQLLPEHLYVYAEWKKVRVHTDYHVEVDGHYYSVSYQLVKH